MSAAIIYSIGDPRLCFDGSVQPLLFVLFMCFAFFYFRMVLDLLINEQIKQRKFKVSMNSVCRLPSTSMSFTGSGF